MNSGKPKGGFFRSLRFRMLVILALLGTLPGVLAIRIVIGSYEKQAIQVRTANLVRQCETVASLVLEEGYPDDEGSVFGRLELLANVLHGRVLLCNRDYVITLDTYRADEGKFMLSPLVQSVTAGAPATKYLPDPGVMEVAVPLDSPAQPEAVGYMLVMASSQEVAETIRSLERREAFLTFGVVSIVLALSFILSSFLVKPFLRVTKAIEDLTDGYHDGEISVPDYTETALITDAFNKLLARMKVLDDSRNEFVSNVSHELKTPMTSMKVLADSLVGQTGVAESLYQEFLGDIAKEIDRENKIISDLLSLVKYDKKAGGLEITHVAINACVEGVLNRLKPLADQRHIDLFLESFRPVEADVDEMKFISIVTNLVENGINYNVADGWVRVTVNADHQYLFLTVADSGMGIPADSMDRIFERFYRVDKSHSAEKGGTGLGLAITKSAIAAHKGSVQVKSTEGEGTTFIVKIPLTYIPGKGEGDARKAKQDAK